MYGMVHDEVLFRYWFIRYPGIHLLLDAVEQLTVEAAIHGFKQVECFLMFVGVVSICALELQVMTAQK